MAKKKADAADTKHANTDDIDDLSKMLIRDLNREFGSRVAYNLSEDESPTKVKRWIDTGSIQINYAIRNAAEGGYPEGRVIEIAGVPSAGKSHLAYHAASVVQAAGGLVVYIDTENATPIDKLATMGVNVAKRFVYCDTHCTEEVFAIIESTVLKAKAIVDKNVPILVIWDSLAATSPKEELDGDYDKQTMGLQARVVSKGMRKITGVIGQNNVTLIIINQLRDAIGVIHGDPQVTPGGKSVPYHASVRIRLTSGTQVKDSKGNVIGIHVIMTIKKNKVARPFGKCEFDIIFGKGISEHEYIFDEVRSWCADNGPVKTPNAEIMISGTSTWKELCVNDPKTGEALLQKKFTKSQFGELMKDEQYAPFIMQAIDAALTIKTGDAAVEHSEGDSPDSDEEENE